MTWNSQVLKEIDLRIFPALIALQTANIYSFPHFGNKLLATLIKTHFANT